MNKDDVVEIAKRIISILSDMETHRTKELYQGFCESSHTGIVLRALESIVESPQTGHWRLRKKIELDSKQIQDLYSEYLQKRARKKQTRKKRAKNDSVKTKIDHIFELYDGKMITAEQVVAILRKEIGMVIKAIDREETGNE